jgi:hypothetical protein
MIRFLFFILFSFFLKTNAQGFTPDWYILEQGSSVGIVKAGVNDIMLYMAAHTRSIDKAAIDEINEGISYSPGNVVLIYARINDTYLASDIEGRTLSVKGNIIRADNKESSGVAYIRQNVKKDGIDLKQGTYVWAKKINKGKKSVTVQYTDKKNIELESDQVYIINETTAEMLPLIKYKEVKE